jgi:hypothetical protein
MSVEPPLLVRPLQPGEPHRPAVDEAVHVGADADAGRGCHRSIMPHRPPALVDAAMMET